MSVLGSGHVAPSVSHTVPIIGAHVLHVMGTLLPGKERAIWKEAMLLAWDSIELSVKSFKHNILVQRRVPLHDFSSIRLLYVEAHIMKISILSNVMKTSKKDQRSFFEKTMLLRSFKAKLELVLEVGCTFWDLLFPSLWLWEKSRI